MKYYVEKKKGIYWPSKKLKEMSWISNDKIYSESEKNPVKFWSALAKKGIKWEKLWDEKNAYVEKLPYFWWFKDGKLNFSVNCLDRNIENGFEEKTALIWVPEPINEKTIKLTYNEIYKKVNKLANVLKRFGVKKGDVVAIYLPLIPEALISMLACARIGAIHSVVFSAFSAEALKVRLLDGKAKILISADGYYRRGSKESLKEKVNEAVKGTRVKKIIIVSRLNKNRNYFGKFSSFEKEIEKAENYCKPETMNSEDPLFILYTSGTTGTPKGIVHDTGGYSTYSYWTSKLTFNLGKKEIIWCTADIGWITGHTYSFYGPLLNGSTTLIYEGTPDFPNWERWWKIIEDNQVNILYTAPTAIRMFMKINSENKNFIKKHNLNSLKILASVGEPIDEKAWRWYFEKIGKSRLPIIDTWWQTETGGIMINTLPGIGPFIPGIAGKSFPGTRHEIISEKGKKSKKGFLMQISPFAPGMLHGIHKNHEKYAETYWKRLKKEYDTSDGAVREKHGLIKITGRTDDVIKVSGHRISTAELENVINKSKMSNESAVVPLSDKIKGHVPIAFVVLNKKIKNNPEEIEEKIKKYVTNSIGPIAKPSRVYFVNELPKTRSGKIMRRILKDLLNNEKPKGITTLVNSESVEQIKKCLNEK